MKRMTRTALLTSVAVTSFTLLGLTANATLASNHNNAKATVAQNANQRPTPTQPSASPAQKQPTQEQMNRMVAQCNSMMKMMGMMNGQGMMGDGNMPGMMNRQNNQPGQGMMNQTPER